MPDNGDSDLIDEIVDEFDVEVRAADIAQMIIGASSLAIPVATAEEIWQLSEQLPWPNIAGIALASLFVISLFVHFVYHQGTPDAPRKHFFARVILSYGLAAIVSAVILSLFQKLPVDEPSVALARVVIVTFPACFAATVVDSLNPGN